MKPIERFKKTNTEDNLWMYLLSLAKDREVISADASRLVFEQFGFLPGRILAATVLFRLQRQGFVSAEKYQGKKAFKTTKAGLEQLGLMKQFSQVLIDKI